MFDRCDADTMAVIDLGADESRRLGHDWLGTEHLLLAFGQRPQLLPDAAAALLPEAGAMRAALALALSAPPPNSAPELLRTVGVDLDQVRAAVRQTFGDEAVDRLSRRRVHQPWQPWRRPSAAVPRCWPARRAWPHGSNKPSNEPATKPTGANGPPSTPPPS